MPSFTPMVESHTQCVSSENHRCTQTRADDVTTMCLRPQKHNCTVGGKFLVFAYVFLYYFYIEFTKCFPDS